MVLIRLAYAADLPGPEEALKALRSGESLMGGGRPSPGGGGGGGATARAPMPQPAAKAEVLANPQSFEDVVRLVDERRDIALRLDIEKYVRPISFRPGAITFEPVAGAPANLAQRLVMRLKEWTGQQWLVAAEGGGGAETMLERQKRARTEAYEQALAEPFVQAVMAAFPGTELVEVRQMATPEPAAPSDEDTEEED